MSALRDAWIVSAVRTAVGKAPRGALSTVRPERMASAAIRGALERVRGLDPRRVEDVLMGCAFPEGEQGMNLGRIAALAAGLPDSVPGATVNRFCSSGLQTIAMAAQAIQTGQADVIVAGGCESMSMIPMGGVHFAPDPVLAAEDPDVYVSMGLTGENVSDEFRVSREEQDAFALRSHRRAIAAIDAGRFRDEIVPLRIDETVYEDGRAVKRERVFEVDEGPRRDTSAEALAKLSTVFKKTGTITAGNSSQTSDGAAAAVVASEEAMRAARAEPLGRFVSFALAGVEPERMGIAPAEAIPRAVKRAGISLRDVGLVELNEAFAAQSVAVIRTLRLDEEIVNVNGGAIALGHPLGCTGAKLTATLLHEMRRRGVRWGVCTMCVGGGMGAAAVFENP
jgi:acetyl-CoA acyltransferase